MILKQGHEYRAMPHDGKVIRRIYRGGRCYYIASPYSHEATQALRAAFPQYWTAISDYGWANPALVPFVNEDPMLIVSLVEVGKVRWLVGDGKAWINLNFKATQNTTAKAKAKLLGKTSVSDYQAIFGARTADKVNGFDICFRYPELMYFDFSNASADNIQLGAPGTEAEVELNKNGGWLNGTKVFNSSTTTFTTPSNVLLFGRTDNSSANARPLNGAIAYVQFGGDQDLHLCPFIRNGENGMLDILSGTFYPNANTHGSFTIAITDKE